MKKYIRNKNAQKMNTSEKITRYRNPLKASTVTMNQVLCLGFCLVLAIVRSSLETSFFKI